MTAGEWQQFALCAQTDPEIFFPVWGDPVTKARRICGACEVQAICLKERLADPDDSYGFVGGKTVQERKALRRAQGDAA